jgi:hypothetical protein
VTVSTPTGSTFVKPMSSAPAWTGRQPTPPKAMVKPVDDDEPVFKGAKE